MPSGLMLGMVKISRRVQMYDGCCNVSKVTTKKVARKLKAKEIEGEYDDDND